ncbi:DNA polymerase III subunit alpha [bacterium]|nr:MAG: DNA polymerase III subunit alpha [bacterium]
MKFSHLHTHTQFSLLDGAASIKKLYAKAIKDNMPAIAITDHGNMFGVFDFVAEAYNHKDANGNPLVKPIVGCEFYITEDRHRKSFSKEDKDPRHHQLFLAKNEIGYKNLVKMTSLGYIEGLYSKYPRIDKELVLKHHEGLIATTCCLGALVPQTILTKGEAEAEKEFLWWLDIFGEDYYVELQRHGIGEQEKVNEILLKFAKKHNVKIIASNDSHYVDQQDANAHDILLCINTGEKQSTPGFDDFINDDTQVKNRRFKFPNDQFFFKTTEQMSKTFGDLPQAIDNTNEIVDKVTALKLKRDILLPNYQVPIEFTSQDDYLVHLTWQGAKQRYSELTPAIEERINFELHTIKTMGFAGYFLIVSDFIKAGRDLGVFVGPGRGSAAGSVVAYCIGITNIDPMKYGLLFERFLNPDRKSMPDIDTDFDDEGRQKVIDYVVKKYGKNQVAHIVTYGTMAAKMSIKDVARVIDLPLAESNALAKLVPDKPGISLKRVLHAPITESEKKDSSEKALSEKEGLRDEDLVNVREIRKIYDDESDLRSSILKEAEILEGSVRNTGIHAAGIIIAPDDLTNILPVAATKDVELLITQYEGSIIEDAGVIKMDFLGLKTLTIIKTALKLIKKNYGVEIEIDSIPLDDKKTYELYQRGETNATFQFESTGMQKYLRDLKPDVFEDLIAMNALYRPGPLQYIPQFINRKLGKEEIIYDLPEQQEYLEETYGVTVYQEQVMLLSQKLAGFTKGDADVLRKAMGKKQKAVLDKMKIKFMEGALQKGLPEAKLEKVWTDWEAFAQYAFNKSHSTCYAFVAYQTGYLKAHYPAEYMAAVLTHNMNDIKKVSFFMEEARRMGIAVDPPSINTGEAEFTVVDGRIQYGLVAIKGVGTAAVEGLVEERNKNGKYKSIFECVSRNDMRSMNRKTLESLIQAGAFDSLHMNRAQLIESLDDVVNYSARLQHEKAMSQASLFGGNTNGSFLAEPKLRDIPAWTNLQRLKRERELIGFYLSAHPLDKFKDDIQLFTTHPINKEVFQALEDGTEITIAGIITTVRKGRNQKGQDYAFVTLEDENDSIELGFFRKSYDSFNHMLVEDNLVLIQCKISKRDDQAARLYVNNLERLESMRENNLGKIRVRLKLKTEEISVMDLEIITSLLASNKGKVPLSLDIFTPSIQRPIRMNARKFVIDPTDDLITQLRNIVGDESVLFEKINMN